jgi:hypothetical protein
MPIDFYIKKIESIIYIEALIGDGDDRQEFSHEIPYPQNGNVKKAVEDWLIEKKLEFEAFINIKKPKAEPKIHRDTIVPASLGLDREKVIAAKEKKDVK